MTPDIDGFCGEPIAADAFAVLRASMSCWKCSATTPVSAIWINEDLSGQAYGEGPALLKYIEFLEPGAMEQVVALAPWMRMTASGTARRTYLANHCTGCGALQGDHFVHGVDGPFFPHTSVDVANIRVHAGHGSLNAHAECSQSSWMERIPTKGIGA